MFEKVRELVAAQLGIDEAVIKPESNFKEDLKADSLDLNLLCHLRMSVQ